MKFLKQNGLLLAAVAIAVAQCFVIFGLQRQIAAHRDEVQAQIAARTKSRDTELQALDRRIKELEAADAAADAE